MINEDDGPDVSTDIACMITKARELDVVVIYCLAVFPNGDMLNVVGQTTPETLLEVPPMPLPGKKMNLVQQREFIKGMERFDTGITRLLSRFGEPLMRLFLNTLVDKVHRQ